VRLSLPADFDRLFASGLGFLAFLAVFVGAGLALCTGRFAFFCTLRAAPLCARRFALRALPTAVLEGLGFFFRRFSTSRSFFMSFLRLFSSFALFLSLLLSRSFDATIPSHPPKRFTVRRIVAVRNSDDSLGLRASDGTLRPQDSMLTRAVPYDGSLSMLGALPA
jgi:hypothetical protein